jgi:hypothetical protein
MVEAVSLQQPFTATSGDENAVYRSKDLPWLATADDVERGRRQLLRVRRNGRQGRRQLFGRTPLRENDVVL